MLHNNKRLDELKDMIFKNNKKFNTCCFTGHRPQSLSFKLNEENVGCIKIKEKLRKIIIQLIENYNVTHFISGVALGVDQYAAEIILELKQHYPHITLECAIPCETQAIKWTEAQRNRYFYILENCDKETLLQFQYTNNCMQKRNEYMVKNSNYIIAVWNEKPSGTGKTVALAKSLNKYIYIINPITFETTTNFQIM